MTEDNKCITVFTERSFTKVRYYAKLYGIKDIYMKQ